MINTDYPESDWNRLELYASRDVLERHYERRHSLQLSPGKASEVIAHLEQGRQYFISAESAGALAGPLEQYYGLLALARALILFLEPSARESALSKSHGLLATLAGDARIEHVQIMVRQGTFNDFLRATRNIEFVFAQNVTIGDNNGLFHRQFPTRFHLSLPRPQLGSGIALVELLSRMPALRTQFEMAFGARAHCHSGSLSLLMARLTISLQAGEHGLPGEAELKSLFGGDRTDAYIAIDATSARVEIPINEGQSIGSILPCAVGSGLATQVIVEPYPEGWSLSELASLFAAAHTQSMLVRYYPTRWTKLLAHEKGDRVLPVLSNLRTAIQRDVPRLVLRELSTDVK